jgi:hypothetical protein
MKIEFPLYLVIDPTPDSELTDIVWTFRDFAQMERILTSGTPLQARDGAFYTDIEEAERDGVARIVARDRAKEAEWVPLSTLRLGAIFETKSGKRGVHVDPGLPGKSGVAWLNSGRVEPIAGETLVRACKVKP